MSTNLLKKYNFDCRKMPRLDPITAADDADRRQLKIPDEINGRIPTLASERDGSHYGCEN